MSAEASHTQNIGHEATEGPTHRDYQGTLGAAVRSDLTSVPFEIARKIEGPGVNLDAFCHALRERRFRWARSRGIGLNRNKDVFLAKLAQKLGEVAASFDYYRGQEWKGWSATSEELIDLAAIASEFAEWDARASARKP